MQPNMPMRRRHLGDATDGIISLTPWTPNAPDPNFQAPNLANDIGYAPVDFSGLSADVPSPYVDFSSLSLPDLSSGLQFDLSSGSVPSSTMTPNRATGGSDTGMSTADWVNTIGKLSQLGVQTYATVSQIQHGNSAPYAFTPTAQRPALVDTSTAPADTTAGPASGFSLASLTDFSTPYPYIAGAALLGLLAMTTGSKKSK